MAVGGEKHRCVLDRVAVPVVVAIRPRIPASTVYPASGQMGKLIMRDGDASPASGVKPKAQPLRVGKVEKHDRDSAAIAQ